MSKKKDSSTLFELITRQRDKIPQGLKRPAWIDAGHEPAEGEPEEAVSAPLAEPPAEIEPITDIEPVTDLEPYAEVEEPPAIEPVEEPSVEAAVEESPEPQVEDMPKAGKRKAKKSPKRRKKAKAARKAPAEVVEETPGPEETAEIIEVPVDEPIEAVEPEAEVVPDETPEVTEPQVEEAAEVTEPQAEEVAEAAEPEAGLPPELPLPFAPHPEPVVEASFAQAFPAAEQPAAPTAFPTPIDEDVVPFVLKAAVVIVLLVAAFFIGRLSVTTPKPQPPAEPIIIKTGNEPIRPKPPVHETDTTSTETVGSTDTSEIDTTETTTTDTTETATTDTTTDATTDTTDTTTDKPDAPARIDRMYYLVIETLYDNSPRANEEAQRMVAFCARNGHEASVQLFSDPDGRRYWAVWSLKPFASETSRDGLDYAHTIEALGRNYSRQYRTKYKFSQRYPADSPTLDPLFVRFAAKTSDESHTDDVE